MSKCELTIVYQLASSKKKSNKKHILLIALLLSCTFIATAQKADSITKEAVQLPKNYIAQIDSKVDKYYNRITNKTEKTLEKLAKWEGRLKPIIEKANPETAQRLFGNNQLTFAKLLQQYKEGKTIADGYRGQYDEYRDKLITSINYIEKEKTNASNKAKKLKQQLDTLDQTVKNTEAIQKFIKERKQQLISQSIQYIGKSKYLQKIDKEAYYYVETLKNYKEIFSDKKKAEETAITILNKIPAFKKFMQENSMLASLFRVPSSGGTNPTANLAGLQTRASVNALIQQQIAAGGPDAAQQIRSNMQAAQAELNKLKDKVLKAGGNSSDAESWGSSPLGRSGGAPNTEKSKTFKQRLEFGTNINFNKQNTFLPTTADIALTAGYKLNAKSIIGIGTSYKMGMGSLQRLSITHQGIGVRSFIDWKLKKQFFISGSYEMNRIFKPFGSLQVSPSGGDLEGAWQQSGLVGISKKLNIKTKFFSASKMSLQYDMLYRNHVPASQPWVWRVGYNF